MKEAPPAVPRADVPAGPSPRRVYWIIAYVVVVLAVDTLAANAVRVPFDWSIFSWAPLRIHQFFAGVLGLPPGLTQWMVPEAGGYRSAATALTAPGFLFARFDFFKFIFWLLIPLAFSLRRFDAGWWGWRRIRRPERWLLLAAPFVALAAMFLIPYLPGLSQYYEQSAGRIPWQGKLAVVIQYNIYTFSWLVGWEFLHRYVLLRAVHQRWPKWGWLLVPLSEALYHLQKPLFEAAAMAVFSIFMTRYTLARRNALWPLIIHWIIEVALLVFILVG